MHIGLPIQQSTHHEIKAGTRFPSQRMRLTGVFMSGGKVGTISFLNDCPTSQLAATDKWVVESVLFDSTEISLSSLSNKVICVARPYWQVPDMLETTQEGLPLVQLPPIIQVVIDVM